MSSGRSDKVMGDWITRERGLLAKLLSSALWVAVGLLCIVAPLLTACSGTGSSKASDSAANNEVTIAKMLTIERHADYTLVVIADPWHPGRELHRYVLVPKASTLPAQLPEGTVIRTPVSNAVVYSSVHAGVLKELGALSVVKGVADAEYYKIPEIKSALQSGSVVNVGSSMSPVIERVVQMRPEVIMLSPFQNGGYGALSSLGIPIVECADYMELSPLGRAEWIKFFGELVARRDEADKIFAATVNAYNGVKAKLHKVSTKPKVITEMLTSGVWFVPGGKSYMAQFLIDAGAEYPWSDRAETGSVQLDFSQVFAKAHDADYWLIKSSTIRTRHDLEQENHLYTKFQAYKQHQVWCCNTEETSFFEEFPFHPERLLSEYAAMFHPEVMGDYKMMYFKRITQ